MAQYSIKLVDFVGTVFFLSCFLVGLVAIIFVILGIGRVSDTTSYHAAMIEADLAYIAKIEHLEQKRGLQCAREMKACETLWDSWK